MQFETYEEVLEIIESNNVYKDSPYELKLLISFHEIEFSHFSKGYYLLSRNVFVSGLVYLLYVKKVKIHLGEEDFEIAKKKAHDILIGDLKNTRKQIVAGKMYLANDCMENMSEAGTKVMLIDRALSILDH